MNDTHRDTFNDYRAQYAWYEYPTLGDGGPAPGDVARYLADGGDEGAELSMLQDIVCLRDWLDDITPTIVDRARLNRSATWAEIGQALGVSRQAAQQRFG